MKMIFGAVFLIGLCSFLALIVFFGGNFSYKRFLLQNGQVVECRLKYINAGAVYLNYCRDGKRYLAQTDVVQFP